MKEQSIACMENSERQEAHCGEPVSNAEGGEEQKRVSKRKIKAVLMPLLFFAAVPAIIVLGLFVFRDRSYNVISIAVALVSCIPFFITFERKRHSSRELIVIAVMTAISVLGRVVFYPLPGFKPVTAIVVIAALYLGAECGFMTGALSAIVSNLFFGQGPWTPFQMFAWGSLGFLTGLLGKRPFMKKWWAQVVVGVLGGVLYSMLMDVWTVLSVSGGFSWGAYLAALASALSWMGVYAVSNVVFLLVLSKPIGNKLERLKIKYDIFAQ